MTAEELDKLIDRLMRDKLLSGEDRADIAELAEVGFRTKAASEGAGTGFDRAVTEIAAKIGAAFHGNTGILIARGLTQAAAQALIKEAK